MVFETLSCLCGLWSVKGSGLDGWSIELGVGSTCGGGMVRLERFDGRPLTIVWEIGKVVGGGS